MVPTLLTVTVCGGEMAFTATGPNSRLPGITAIDAVLRAKRAAERRGRVVELQRQAAFDPVGELYPVGVGRHQHVVMQIAIADVSIDGQLKVRVIRPYLRAG